MTAAHSNPSVEASRNRARRLMAKVIDARQAAAEAERAAVVKWLRRQAATLNTFGQTQYFADAIERGDHLTTGGE